jgi:hypothetical protein
LIELAVGRYHLQVVAQHHQGLSQSLHNGIGVVARLPQLICTALELIDIDQHYHRSVDVVVEGAVGANSQVVPVVILVLYS